MYRISKSGWQVPVVIHNHKGHDVHLIVKTLKGEFGKVRVIPQNIEKYLSLTVGRLKFIYSFQFTPQRLDSLVKTLADDEFMYVWESFSAQQSRLIKRKGVYPYEYMDSFARLDESRLPSQDAFFNKLFDSPCSEAEDAHAIRWGTAFGYESMADYPDIYLRCAALGRPLREVSCNLFGALWSRFCTLLHHSRSRL